MNTCKFRNEKVSTVHEAFLMSSEVFSKEFIKTVIICSWGDWRDTSEITIIPHSKFTRKLGLQVLSTFKVIAPYCWQILRKTALLLFMIKADTIYRDSWSLHHTMYNRTEGAALLHVLISSKQSQPSAKDNRKNRGGATRLQNVFAFVSVCKENGDGIKYLSHIW